MLSMQCLAITKTLVDDLVLKHKTSLKYSPFLLLFQKQFIKIEYIRDILLSAFSNISLKPISHC